MCLLHTVKFILLMAKNLPYITHDKNHTVNNFYFVCLLSGTRPQEFSVCTSHPRQKNLKNIKKIRAPLLGPTTGPHHAGLGPPCVGRRPNAGLCVRLEARPPLPQGSRSEVADGVERGGPG